MTTKQFNEFKKFAFKAKTKYDMCYYMDRMHWKNISWVHLMYGVLDKAAIKAEYEIFLIDLEF